MAATKTEGKVLSLSKTKETKGFLVFGENSANPAITPLYVRKDVAAELGITDDLTITLHSA